MCTAQQIAALRAACRAYRDRPLPPNPTAVLPGASRVEILRERFRLKRSLWHPADINEDYIDGLGQRIQVLANGRTLIDGVEIVGQPQYREQREAVMEWVP